MKNIKRIQEGSLRFYQKGNYKHPSITTVLSMLPKKALIQWAVNQTIEYLSTKKKIDSEVLSKAKYIHKYNLGKTSSEGTSHHDNIEHYLLHGFPLEDNNTIHRFKEFEKTYDFKADLIEEFLFSDTLKVGGTADLIGSVYGNLCVIDIKTSKQIYLSHKIQACVYAEMFKEKVGKEVTPGILLIPRNTKKKWELLLIEDVEEKKYLMAIYRCARTMFECYQKLGEHLTN